NGPYVIPALGDLNDANWAPIWKGLGVSGNDPNREGSIPPSNSSAGAVPAPTKTQGANKSFYIIGPKNVQNLQTGATQGTIPGNDNLAVSYEPPPLAGLTNPLSAMMWTLPNDGTFDPTDNGMGTKPVQVTAPNAPSAILLRRLLCPHLAPNPAVPANPGDPPGDVNQSLPYNPYITVDYVPIVTSTTAIHMALDHIARPHLS